jgi:hypothetical protein
VAHSLIPAPVLLSRDSAIAPIHLGSIHANREKCGVPQRFAGVAKRARGDAADLVSLDARGCSFRRLNDQTFSRLSESTQIYFDELI